MRDLLAKKNSAFHGLTLLAAWECLLLRNPPWDHHFGLWEVGQRDNAFLKKRGWRDEASEELAESKKEAGFSNREDIQTWIDLHDAEEGRTPRALSRAKSWAFVGGESQSSSCIKLTTCVAQSPASNG